MIRRTPRSTRAVTLFPFPTRCRSEEVNRMVVACIADLNFAPTKAAADALLRENRHPETIYVTGNSVIDALLATRARIEAQPSLAAGLADLVDWIGRATCWARVWRCGECELGDG